jgi:hypothetical protein
MTPPGEPELVPRYYIIRIALGPLPEDAVPSDEDRTFHDVALQAVKRVTPGLDAICDAWISEGPPRPPPLSLDARLVEAERDLLQEALMQAARDITRIERERDELQANLDARKETT